MKAKDYFNIECRKMIQALLHIFYVFPIRSNRILFESFEGRSYSCNPKYICEQFLREGDNFDLIWSLRDPLHCAVPEGVKSIKKNSASFFYYRLTSKIILSNMTDPTYLPKRKGQTVICTWHAGGAYKKIGNSFNKNDSDRKRWQMDQLKKKTDVWLSSSALFTRYIIEDAYDFDGLVLPSGMPRNDLFFKKEQLLEIKQRVSRDYPLEDCYVILYAPTFRGDRVKASQNGFRFPEEAFCQLLSEKLGKKILFLSRQHYYVKNEELHSIKEHGSYIFFDSSDYPDMQELLVAADMLITDYSSSMWDYCLTGKPCLLWIPDWELYREERGTYTPIESWPGLLCRTEEELLSAAENLEKIDFMAKAQMHLKKFHSYEQGTASKTVYEYIVGRCKDNSVIQI